jgi:alkylglycerol monooxygenase
VPGEVIAIIAPLHLFLQYWYHTRLIGRMGFLEHIIVTPSHHRVHHAINPEYMDKNLGQVFIIWDKLFGTFQVELPEVPPVYGVTRPARTWNPFRINFQHFWLLLKDAWRTHSWWDRLRIWFMPTGWRPADVRELYPVDYISDPYHFTKYDTPVSPAFKAWAWAQLFFQYFLLVYFFANLSYIGTPVIFLYGAFIFISVFAYTEMMDGNPNARYYEAVKSAFGLYLLLIAGGDWFGVNEQWGAWYSWIVGVFLVASPLAGWYWRFYGTAH